MSLFSDRTGLAEGAGLRSLWGKRALHSVANLDVGAFRAGNGATDQDQAALGVDAPNEDVLGGDRFLTEVTGHLLALEHLARVLTLAG